MQNTVTQQQDRRVAIWLLICCALVFAMVVLGGVTRLTGSGLSMVDWNPVTGVLPPLSEAEWLKTFEMYQQSPEFQKVNSHMDVEAFKGIFWLEFLHRLLGRLIGVVFFLPFLVFAAKGYIGRHEWPKYLLMFVLGGMQGLIGWYMVKSGLVNDPHVSQYRLTTHLVAAFLIYAYMFWVALSLLWPRSSSERHPWFGKAVAVTSLVSITIVSGGFVAGLKAGRIFNTFPMMGDYWIPPGVMALAPAWRNFFDNPATVQLDHRILAIMTFFVVIAFWALIQKTDLSARATTAVHGLLAALIVQVTLGILTLLYYVPTALAATHQAVAMLLFTAALYLAHCLRDSLASKPQ
jgi:cytochrome c oxidase assembly protein subunit 15